MSRYNFLPVMANFKGGHYEGLTLSKSATNISTRLIEKFKYKKYLLVAIDKEKQAILLTPVKDKTRGAYTINTSAHSFSNAMLKKELPFGRYLLQEETPSGFILVKE